MTPIDHIATRPGDPGYDAARTTPAGSATPAVVLRPTSPAEVAAALAHARAERLELAVRGGGHNVLGFGNSDGGAVLDLSRLDRIELLGEGRVRIGAGATWGAVAATLAPHRLAISSGDTASVGVGGLTQAGGMGWLVRRHGLALDSLRAAEVVTAAGELVCASATENPDLFWALRGGAGNFGVVTAFEFQAHPVERVHFGTLAFADDDTPRLVREWAALAASAPETLSTALMLAPGFGGGPAGALLFACLADDDPSALQPFRGLGQVVADDIAAQPYAGVLNDAHPPEGMQVALDNTLLGRLDEELVASVVAAHEAGPRMVMLRALGGAFGRVAPDATAFAHRDAQALAVSAAFLPTDAAPAQVAEARAPWRPVRERGVGAYAGFLGSTSPEDLASVWPADTLARLREVKRRWDPDNAFRRNLNIAPAA